MPVKKKLVAATFGLCWMVLATAGANAACSLGGAGIAFGSYDPINPAPQKFMWCSHNFMKILSRTVRRYQLGLSIDLHDHEIVMINVAFPKSISMTDVDEIPTIFAAGQKAIDKKKDEILAAVASFSKRKDR